ncbi:ABC transporter permease [Aquabacterium sp.]|jgi:putative spermidine/putrescine transport system permease protein|uniref:ABC transporter permease n=1 Tax=Aquabacterium sp. TaxID=1872578 RepID=UPI0025C4228B|nr:ABC transporter permease [Aquabacterium sp.]
MLLDHDKLGWPLKLGLGLIAVLVCGFLLAPIVFIALLSFGSSPWLIFPPPGWTLQWYREMWADPGWLQATWHSTKVALIVMVLAVSLGFLTALALVRGRFPGRAWLRGFFLTPMVLPVVVLAVALYAMCLKMGLTGTLTGFVIGHLVIALPFAIITLCNALEGYDFALEEAALICGATPWQVKWRVTLPALRLSLFAAAVFAFLVSWDEVVVSIFMATPGMETLPVRIWSTLRQDLSPVIAAVSTVLIGFTLLLMLIAAAFRKGPQHGQ